MVLALALFAGTAFAARATAAPAAKKAAAAPAPQKAPAAPAAKKAAAAPASQERTTELAGRLAPTREQVRSLPGGITLRIAAGSVVERQPSTHLPLGSGSAPKTRTHVVKLIAGRVTGSTPKTGGLPTVALLVYAPRKVSAVIAGGRGEVVVRPESVTFGALEGEMLTAVNDHWRKLPEGQARSVEGDGATNQRAILGAPTFNRAQSLIVAPSDGAGSVEFDWRAVPQAVSYAVSIRAAEDPAPIREFNVTSTNATVEGLRPGRYVLSVAAVDRYGLNGKSGTTHVRALGLELPAGARQLGDAIELDRRQRIHFTDPKGLEVTYGKATAFVPAPRDVGLAGGAATLVRVRVPGERGELHLRLVPVEVHTGISLVTGAKGWPREAGKLRIAFRDGHGRLLARAPDTAVEVRVNRLPVKVQWQRRGGVMEGTLPARAGWGPYSVGVRVKDKFGQEIGREVLQIATSEKAKPSTSAKR
ncbi:MAG TPA: fibronectin type III domain-containing protein [Polyangiaceae bacterium]|nr:fibronectin type III domain-containing protein [Polyangiaceae bacterium]